MGRLAAEWMADWSNSAFPDLVLQAAAGCVLVIVWAFLPPGAGRHAVFAFAIGAAAASWPGVILSEVSRLAAPGRIAEAAAGSTTITFLGYVGGPLIFSLLPRWNGGRVARYMFVAAQAGAMAIVLTIWSGRRRPGSALAAGIDAIQQRSD